MRGGGGGIFTVLEIFDSGFLFIARCGVWVVSRVSSCVRRALREVMCVAYRTVVFNGHESKITEFPRRSVVIQN